MYDWTSIRIRRYVRKVNESGMNVARLNFSHGSHDEHAARIRSIRKIAKKLEKNIGILLDTKGPEIRTHDMKDGIITLEKGSHVIVSMRKLKVQRKSSLSHTKT